MLTMTVSVLAVRFGSMDDEKGKSFKWAKVMTIEDNIEESEGFIGQRTVEYSVPSEFVDSVVANAKHEGCVPNLCKLEFQVSMSGGKAMLKCIALYKPSK